MIGTNAFGSVNAAIFTSVSNGPAGTIVVNGGFYNEAVNVNDTVLLYIQSGGTSGNDSGPVTFASLRSPVTSATIQLNNGVNLVVGDTTSRSILSVISGNGSLTKTGTGILTLQALNAYTGATTVNGGTLVQAVLAAIPNTPVAVNSGTLDLHGFNTTIGSVSGTGSGTITSSVAGAITLTIGDSSSVTYAGIIKNGSGTLSVTKIGSGIETLSGSNQFTGALSISAGTLQYGANDVIADTVPVTVASGATYDTGGFSDTVAALIGAGNVSLGSGLTGTLTAGGNNASTTYSGTMSGTGGFTKAGSGTLTLSGANTYQGTTTIAAGTLLMANAKALGSSSGSATFVQSGATLDISGQTVDPTELLNITGTGVGGNGALVNNGAAGGLVTQVFVSGSATIGGNTRFDFKNGSSPSVTGYIHSGTSTTPTPGTTFDLTKVGSAEDVISVPDDADLNNINVNVGRLTFDTGGTMGKTSGTMSIASGAIGSLYSGGTNTNVKNVTVSSGGTLLGAGAAAANVDILGDATTTLTLLGTATIQSDVIFTIASKVTGTPTTTVKTGTGTLTLTNTTNDYTGTISISAGIFDAVNVASTGSTDGAIIVNGGTLQWDGTYQFPSTKVLTISGSGQGGIGAINKVNGSGTLSQNITYNPTATIGNSTAATKLTLAGNLVLPAIGNANFTGAGDIEVVNSFGNGPSVPANGLLSTWYPGVRGDVNLINPNSSPNGYLTLTPANTFPQTTALGPLFSTAQLITLSGIVSQMNNNGNQFGAVWAGTITVGGTSAFPAGPISFGTNSDDGSAIYVDLNQDGIFGDSTGELVVDSRGGHGTTGGVIGTATLAAGTYPVYIGYYESSGGGGFEARAAVGSAVAYGTQLIIDPSSAAQAGVWSTPSGNAVNVAMSTGTVTFDAANNYSGITSITSGTLVAANNNALGLPASGTVVSGTGTLAHLASGIALANEPLTLTGTGSAGNAGALVSQGPATYTGTISGSATAGTTVGIGTNSGSLTINGKIDLLNSSITFNGTAPVTVASSISSSTPSTSNALVKNGTGTVTLQAANLYAGVTSVNAGILDVQNACSASVQRRPGPRSGPAPR